ncbi:MAG: cysteine hydrolase [Acidobacteria bacterium]|nr:cysteine hydrolase [Acidobacteriota bacterium]
MNTVFFDVDTQFDFLYPAGALYVPGAETLLPALARLTNFAAAHGLPIISTMDAHSGHDPEFKAWPHHCVAGCLGQRKPEATLLGTRGRQYFLEKQHVNCFTSAALMPLLAQLQADHYVVYGVVTEICVRHALRGLLATGKRVTVLADAIQAPDPAAAQATLDERVAAGGEVSSTATF